MSTAVFPSLIGQGWSVAKAPGFATRIQRAVSGRELRVLDMPSPLWTFTLTFTYLPVADLQTLMGFFLARQGAYDTFLFDDPSDDAVFAQQIGIGDGSTTVFQLGRGLGGFFEPIAAPNRVGAVYLNGIVQGGYRVDAGTGLVTFATAPDAGLSITVDFTYYFRCRFLDDASQFENFMQNLWQLQKLQFVSVLP
ncbi:MAG: DUF2460 domain-containing protein [Alphaproteobacteria bacterium]|nr:DUF2460 domain-containing protein [Alphaproteobacteria bacterium]